MEQKRSLSPGAPVEPQVRLSCGTDDPSTSPSPALAHPAHAPGDTAGGLALGVIRGFHNGSPLIEVPGHAAPVAAIAVTCSLSPGDVGQIVAVAFDRSDHQRPIVVGRVVAGLELADQPSGKLALSADEEITLRCGKASIILKADGTVAVRGVNVVTRATDTNRIRGGNVQIN